MAGPSSSRCCGCGPRDSRRARWSSTPAGPARPGRRTPRPLPACSAPRSLAGYDVVGFDPRGTGTSEPVDCLTDAELDTYVASDPSPDDAAEADRFVGLVTSIGRGCAADDAELAAHVSTIEAARDMDVLRSALGHEQLDYLGKSYGTMLGATYAELFPEQVGRFVLDGALDVSAVVPRPEPGPGRGLRDRAALLRRQLRRHHRHLLPR